MKKIFLQLLMPSFVVVVIFLSCKKEKFCEGCLTNPPSNETNKPPVAIAGPDQAITLPTDSILLDGSASNDPDGKINEWLWKKISGPTSFAIINPSVSKTSVKNLVEGVYQFELTVMDNKNLSVKDTVQVIVKQNASPSTEIIFTGLIWQHWHQSNLPDNFTDFDEIYFYVPDSANAIHNNAGKASFSVWVKRNSSTAWEKASSVWGSAPFWYVPLQDNSLLIELCYPWDWSLIGNEASVKINF